MSADPVMESYIPEASSNEGAGERNQNLPGLGGVFNSRNFQVYHYAGNNPLKYTDPTGRYSTIEELQFLEELIKNDPENWGNFWQEYSEGMQYFFNKMGEYVYNTQQFLKKHHIAISLGEQWGVEVVSIGFTVSLTDQKLILSIDLGIITIDNENGVQLNTSIGFNLGPLSVEIDLMSALGVEIKNLFNSIELSVDNFWKEKEDRTQQEVDAFYNEMNERVQQFNEYIKNKYGIEVLTENEGEIK